ncbi:gem-associated protein 6-like [Acanthaster planci]|uniref:Gem-associated protein 6-like n=1 Tax=Acanthaster planci TaxID=133434 RepID=A0A8B7Y4Z3_ACAPL|nr:gem-associated protein 6-like [Acanthaster planci]
MAAPMDGREDRLTCKAKQVFKGTDFVELSPSDWCLLVSKRVEVISTDSKSHTGWIFTVDPVSRSIVLADFPDNQRAMTEVIMGHAIHTVTLVGDPTPQCLDRLNGLLQSGGQSDNLSAEEIAQRKTDLKQWLEKHHIPVALSGENSDLLSIAGALYIEPPYGVQNCVSANEIILARVQALIQAKPELSSPRTCSNENFHV